MALLIPNVPWNEHDPSSALVAIYLETSLTSVRSAQLVRKSLDARQRRPRWVAVFRVEVEDEDIILARGIAGVRTWTARDEGRYGLDADGPVRRALPSDLRPIVIGAGPAGLFSALYLAEAGAKVTLIDRGSAVEGRTQAVNRHWRGRAPLDPENNLVFGEGGAGTFSDGKIYTRRRDGELGYIFTRLVEFGAPREVIQDAWAHLGTDRIRALLVPFRQRLADLGVEIRYDTRVVDLRVEAQRCVGVVLEDGSELAGSPVLVATGHSARDSAEMLVRAGARASARGIAVGARVEHPQELVDRARYRGAERGALPPASYRLAHNPEGRPAVRTFCMCPGGMVVPANNDVERVVVNGMSFAARRAFWANSAVIVEVPPEAYGADDPLAGFRWQDAIEARAFEMAGRDGAAPAQRVVDFLAKRVSEDLPRASYPLGVRPGDLHDLFPDLVADGIREGLRAFDDKLAGFAGPDAVLIAPETRTTSPVRFLRDEAGCSTSVMDLFPIGEGAGYAGGIVSSALDGLRAARAIVGLASSR